MSPPSGDCEGRGFSGNELDDDEDLDIEGLDDIRLACMPSTIGADDDHDRPHTSAAECSGGLAVASSVHDDDDDDDGEDDFELARDIMNRYSGEVGEGALCTVTESDDDLADRELLQSIEKKYSVTLDVSQPMSSKPLSSIPPSMVDDDEDDFETLRAIEKRFRAYDKDKAGNPLSEPVSDTSYEEETSDKFLSSNVPYDLPDALRATDLLAETPTTSKTHASSQLPRTRSQFPVAAQFIIDAIKKNRSSQKFLRTKLIQMESKIEENKELMKRLGALKDFQTLCRKRTGNALSLKKDPRVQLISVKKVNLKKTSVMHFGPEENAHVANYKRVLGSFPLSFVRKKWSNEEKENLGKGIRQEFQEMLTQVSLNMFCLDGSSGDINDFDNVLASIKDFEIMPEHIREFLPKVNWDKLASKYVVGRSGAECEARWLNCDDPLINQSIWNSEENKTLLDIVSERGPRNWFDIAETLSTGRTPFQCLLRYQRSLNPSMLNKEWTEEEDDKLRTAVERFGENDWQSVASAVENRTGAQCSNRWKKSLCPQRKGNFSPDEDKRLKIGIMFFGQKWEKIAQYILGRTGAQCRDRYVNSLDPELKWDAWSEEEDARLVAALEKYQFCWSKIAKEVDKRTDAQCRKRWMKLFPEDIPKLQEAKRQKSALISNFVDREAERPAFTLDSFLPLPMLCSAPESDNLRKRRKRNNCKVARIKAKLCDKRTQNVRKRTRRREQKKRDENCSDEQLIITPNEIEPYNGALVVEHAIGPHSGNHSILAVPDNCLAPQDATLVNDGKQAHNAFKKTRTRKRKKRNENYSCEQHVNTSNEIEPYNDAPVVEDAVGWHSGNNSIITVPDNCLIPPDAALVKHKKRISELGSRDKKKTSNLRSRKKKSTMPLEIHGSLLSSNPEPVTINGVYVEPHRNNLAVEREAASKDNCHEKLCARETCENDAQNNFSHRNISECEVFNLGEDGVTGAVENQRCEPMHSEGQLESLSEKTRETPADNDMTLACFLQNRLKKKRIKLSKNFARTGNRMSTGTGNQVSPTRCLNESLDIVSHSELQSVEWTSRSICEPSEPKKSNDGTPLLGEQEAANMATDSEDVELPLVYLLGSKLKKRLEARKKCRTLCPSPGKESGLLADAEVRCNGDNSETLSSFGKENREHHGEIPVILQVQNQLSNSSSNRKACDSDKDGSMIAKKNSASQNEAAEKRTSFKTYQRRGKGRRNG